MAAGGARAAAGEAADHWIFGPPNTRSLDSHRLDAFVQRLRELGWIEGRTIAIEYRWAERRNERLAETAAEFVRRKVDVIVTSATPPTFATKCLNHPRPDLVRSIGVCPASPPTP
jgi:hypothetical protein